MNELRDNTILIVTDNPYPSDTRIKHQSKALLNAGANVIIFSLRHCKETPEIEIDGNLIIYRFYLQKLLSNKLKASILRFPFYTKLLFNQINKLIERLDIKLDAVQICDLLNLK